MHPDRKIGCAMGILLIGVVGALFFRNEPLATNDVPAVRREQQLNDQLRARDVAVYLDDRTIVETNSPASDTENRRWTLRDLLKDLNDRHDGVPLPIPVKSDPAISMDQPAREIPAAEQFRRVPANRSEAADQIVSQRRSAEEISQLNDLPPLIPPSDGRQTAAAVQEPVAATGEAAATPFDEYVVRYGDTLSQIAERFLGSQGRYQEIYDMNRDRLAAPDRLQVGKAIRIPRY